MQINVSQALNGYDGKPLLRSESGKDTPITLGWACCEVLVSPPQGNESQAGAESVRRFRLATEIHESDVVDLSAEQVAELKALIEARYPPAMVAAAWLALDPPPVKIQAVEAVA